MVRRFDIVIIMAGGKGKRIGNHEKHLLGIGNTTIIERLIKQLSRYSKTVIIATSALHKNLIRIVKNYTNVDVVVLSGSDYSLDMCMIINVIKTRPLIILPGDLVIFNITKFINILETCVSTNSTNHDLISIDYMDGSVSGICIVLAIYCNYGQELSWISMHVLGRDIVLDVDTQRDYEYVIKVLSNAP